MIVGTCQGALCDKRAGATPTDRTSLIQLHCCSELSPSTIYYKGIMYFLNTLSLVIRYLRKGKKCCMPVMRWRVKKMWAKKPCRQQCQCKSGRRCSRHQSRDQPAAHVDSMEVLIQLQPMDRNTEQISTLMLGGRGCKSTMSEFEPEKKRGMKAKWVYFCLSHSPNFNWSLIFLS